MIDNLDNMPVVRTSEGFIEAWNREKIVNQIVKETKLCEKFYKTPAATKEEAEEVAKKAERVIRNMGLTNLSGPLVREVVNNIMLEEGHADWRNAMTRVGACVNDALEIDFGSGFEANDNANQLNNAETSHKRKADKMSKEQNLLLLPSHISDAHLRGDLVIHDLEYFGTRPFCQDWDARYCFYYGLMPDGIGKQSSVAKPAKNAEVAILHLVKLMGSAQTNFSGGQGLYNFLIFLAPYLEGKSEVEIKQLMQMFVYEMMQMMTARGGQTVFSSVQCSPGVSKLWVDKPVVFNGKVWDGKQAPLRVYGEFEREVRLGFKALMDVMLEGDAWGKPFSFPKPEISVEKDFMTENEDFNKVHPELPTYSVLYKKSFELAAKFGTPYFDNQIPDYRSAKGGVTCYQCCLSSDTLIPIEDTYGIRLINIAELNKVNKIYATHSDKKWSKFDDILVKDVDTIMTITDEFCRKVVCTSDHELPVISNGIETKKKVSDINIKLDKLIQVTPEFGIDISILTDLPVECYDSMLIDFARLLGLYAAEGSTSAHNSSRYVIWSFSTSEVELVEETRNLVRKLFNIEPCVCTTNHGKGTDVRIGSQMVYNWFVNHNIAMHGYSMEVPPFIFKFPDEAKWAFMHGYFDGDGCYRKNGKANKAQRRIEFNSISKKLITGVLLLAQSLGLNMHYGEYKDKRENRKPRFMLTINKEEDIAAFFNCEVRQIKKCVIIKKICVTEYTGSVYDPVNVEGHNFLLGNGVVSGNCAYQFSANPEDDKEFDDKINFVEGKHFSMGSWQVMSLNCPRAAYKAEHDDKKLIAELKALMDKAIEVFKIKREWMNELIARNRIPFASQRPLDPVTRELGSVAVDFESLVYTIGVVGINEMVQYHTGSQIHESDKAYKLAIRIMFEMKLYAQELSKKHNMTIALARTPAETTAQRFAVSDLLHEEYREKAMQCVKGDVQKSLNNISKTRDLPVYYTNGTHLPVNAKVSLPERIKYEQTFFPIVDGGNIMHIWMGEKSPNPEGLMDFAMNLCKNSQVGYFAFTRDMTVCIDEGYVASGILEKCPKCGSENVQHLSRITGYLQSVEGWNEGKKQELKDRKRYEIS